MKSSLCGSPGRPCLNQLRLRAATMPHALSICSSPLLSIKTSNPRYEAQAWKVAHVF